MPSLRTLQRRVDLHRVATVVGVTALLVGLAPPTIFAQTKAPRRLAFGKCAAEVRRITGESPVQVGGKTKLQAPRKLRDVRPNYPISATVRRVGFAWLGEALIGLDGKVERVWTIKEIEFSPPWPEFNRAIVDAIGQWVFEPTKLDGRPVPICMSVSVNVNWQ